MDLMVLKITGIQKLSPKKCFQKGIQGEDPLWFGGAFSAKRKLTLQFIDKKLNSNVYIDILKRAKFSKYGKILGGKKWLFQQDNAPIHKAKVTMNYFKSEKINLLEHPPCSPDLTPIENLWGLLVAKIYDDGKQYKNIKELKKRNYSSMEQNKTKHPFKIG